MLEVARIDIGDRHDDENVGRAELLIDDGAVAEISAQAQVGLDERRHRFQRSLLIDLGHRHAVHRDIELLARAAAPFLGSQSPMVKIAQRHPVLVEVDPLEARAADHHVDAVLADVCPKAVPEKLDRALAAIRSQYAGAAELHESVRR